MKRIKAYIIVLIIISLFNDSFAAIISDNDGAAFITKAEFDSLKNGFQSQLNYYNDSIDEKIDGAIVGYLSGVKIAKTVKSNIIFNDWDDVTCYNGAYAPTYGLPSVNIAYTYSHCWPKPMQQNGGSGANRNGYWNIAIMFKYNNPGSDNVYRPLITGNVENDQTTNMVWGGIAYKYMEYWNMGKSNINTNGTWLMWLDGPTTYEYGGTLRNSLRFSPSGYYTSANSILATWTPSLFWRYRQNGTTTWNTQNITIDSGNDKTATCVFNVELAKNGDDTTFHDHIIEYDGSKRWKVSNKDFTKTFRPASSLNSTNLFTVASKSGLVANWGILTRIGWTITESNQRYTASSINPPAAESSYFNNGGSTSTPDVEDVSATTLPCIGMLSEDQEANDIYQFGNKINFTSNGKNITLEKQTLEKGFPLFYVNKDSEISWEPEFRKYYKKNGTNWVEQNNNIRLYLSYGPFVDLTSTSKPVEFTTDSFSTKATSQVMDLTGDRVSFKATEDAIIYAKWVPETSGYASDTWYSTLDLSKCSQYRYTENS